MQRPLSPVHWSAVLGSTAVLVWSVPGLIKSNWGAVMRPYDRGLDRFGAPEVYVEVVPVAHVADGEEVSGRSVAA